MTGPAEHMPSYEVVPNVGIHPAALAAESLTRQMYQHAPILEHSASEYAGQPIDGFGSTVLNYLLRFDPEDIPPHAMKEHVVAFADQLEKIANVYGMVVRVPYSLAFNRLRRYTRGEGLRSIVQGTMTRPENVIPGISQRLNDLAHQGLTLDVLRAQFVALVDAPSEQPYDMLGTLTAAIPPSSLATRGVVRKPKLQEEAREVIQENRSVLILRNSENRIRVIDWRFGFGRNSLEGQALAVQLGYMIVPITKQTLEQALQVVRANIEAILLEQRNRIHGGGKYKQPGDMTLKEVEAISALLCPLRESGLRPMNFWALEQQLMAERSENGTNSTKRLRTLREDVDSGLDKLLNMLISDTHKAEIQAKLDMQ